MKKVFFDSESDRILALKILNLFGSGGSFSIKFCARFEKIFEVVSNGMRTERQNIIFTEINI